MEGVSHCARSDTFTAGGVVAASDADAENLEPWYWIRPTAEVSVQLVLFTEQRPLPFVGSSGCVSSSREAGSHRCLDSEEVAAESILGLKWQICHGCACGK
jgi:hypothetical protein